MRGSQLLASWAPRAASRQLTQPGASGIGNLVPRGQAQAPHPSNVLRGLYSGAPEPIRSGNYVPRTVISSRPLHYVGLRSSLSGPGVTEQVRYLSVTRQFLNAKAQTTATTKLDDPRRASQEKDGKELEQGFELSEKAAQAAQLNLSAKLGKDGLGGKKAGFREIWRLLQIARPEAKILSLAFFLLLVSSSITMSIPFSIGKIMDMATKSGGEGANELFGLSPPMFYGALAGVIALGAAANYGRIIILRIVGERIVSRLRSKLFRRTLVQDAEFFDANRVGDLISRLSSDTIIVGKSITQNLSDGLRAAVSGAAGFSLMAYVSLKLSSILALLLPPVALGAFLYGRAIRNLSRKIQKNLGTLTKIAEERLGNVKTSQSFAAEVQEVHRYNNQVRQIFNLGKRESLISATFFSSVCNTPIVSNLHAC